jgi:hypothetical protein
LRSRFFVPHGGEMVTDDRLNQSVYLKAVLVSMGERKANHGADYIIKRIGVRGHGAKRFIQEAGMLGKQRQRDGFGGHERADVKQSYGRRAGGAEPFQGDFPGGVDTALVI